MSYHGARGRLPRLLSDRYAAQRKSRFDEAATAAAAAIALAPHDHKMYAVRATAAYKKRDW